MYIASNDKKKIHASSRLKNLRFSKYFDDITQVWSNLKREMTVFFVDIKCTEFDYMYTTQINLLITMKIRCENNMTDSN